MISNSMNKTPRTLAGAPATGGRCMIGFLRRVSFIAIATISALAASTTASHASTLIGQDIEAQYEYPSLGIVYGLPTGPFEVGDGIEAVIDIEGVTQLNIDFSASSLLITLNTILEAPTWNGPPVYPSQNGPVFSISSSAFPAIASVVFSPGFVCAFPLQGCVYLSPESDKLFINWAGWSYQNGATVRVDFVTAPVPLPAALPLFAAGLGAMGFMGWRRKRKAIA